MMVKFLPTFSGFLTAALLIIVAYLWGSMPLVVYGIGLVLGFFGGVVFALCFLDLGVPDND